MTFVMVFILKMVWVWFGKFFYLKWFEFSLGSFFIGNDLILGSFYFEMVEFGLGSFFIWNDLILGGFYFEMVWVWFGKFLFWNGWVWFGKFFYWKWFDFGKFLFWNGLSLVWEVFILKWLLTRTLSVCGEIDFISLCVWHLAVCWIDGFLFWNENWELKVRIV